MRASHRRLGFKAAECHLPAIVRIAALRTDLLGPRIEAEELIGNRASLDPLIVQ